MRRIFLVFWIKAHIPKVFLPNVQAMNAGIKKTKRSACICLIRVYLLRESSLLSESSFRWIIIVESSLLSVSVLLEASCWIGIIIQVKPTNYKTFRNLFNLLRWTVFFGVCFGGPVVPNLSFGGPEGCLGASQSPPKRKSIHSESIHHHSVHLFEGSSNQKKGEMTTKNRGHVFCPIPSMYRLFTYIWLIFMVNVGK